MVEMTTQEIQQQAGKILSQVAGYVGTRTINMGMRFGLFEEIAKHPTGITAEALATKKGLDPFYVRVWARSAYASEVLEVGDSDAYTLAPHMDKLLVNQDFPGYLGAITEVMLQPEIFDRFADNFHSGQRIWWDDCGPEFIRGVSATGRTFYNRLIPNGFSQVPGLTERLTQGARVLETACGAGAGLVKMAQAYPQSSFVGVDGDSYSLELAGELLRDSGLEGKVSLTRSTLEEFSADGEFDMVLNNISMHECRDIDRVTRNVHQALRPDGYFIISDFPFPESIEECRTVPARIMSGIHFFEALIDDQLLSKKAYIELLGKHGFRNVSAFDITPVHAVTHGQK